MASEDQSWSGSEGQFICSGRAEEGSVHQGLRHVSVRKKVFLTDLTACHRSFAIEDLVRNVCVSKQGDIRFHSDVTAGVMAQEEEVVTGPAPTVDVKANVRGDMIPMATEAPGKKCSSVKGVL